jgi:leucyl-tRNA synthetase
MEMFGQDFENFQPPAPEEEVPAPIELSSTLDTAAKPVDKAKKGKISAKNTGLTYQFQIMQSIGVPKEEIKKFADPYYWLSYFPPIAKVRNHTLHHSL